MNSFLLAINYLRYASIAFILSQAGMQVLAQPMEAFISELQELHDLTRLPAYRIDSKVGLISTYDTTGGNDDGFSGKYSYIRKEGGGRVLADLQGPGVIQRIHTPTPTEKMLAFYFDGEEHPRLRIPFIELFSGEHYPFIKPIVGNEVGGYFSYVPIPYEKSLKIVYEGDDIRFHQIQYRTYPQSSVVKSFDTSLSSAEDTALQQVVERWSAMGERPWGSSVGEVKSIEKTFIIEPGGTAELFDHIEGGRIVGIEIDRDFEQWDPRIVLEAYWDDDSVPSIMCPANDFFGYSFGKVAMQGLYMGAFSGGYDYCYLPMPYRRQAKLQLRSLSEDIRRVTGTVRIFYTLSPRDVSTEGQFYTVWRREEPEIGTPYLISAVKGKGHHVGTILQSQGLVPSNTVFFEGDDVVFIDDEHMLHGGGSEDYFNGGWYWILDRWDKGISLPIHGSLEYSLSHARTGGYRLFLSDKLSFDSHFHFTVEHGPVGNDWPVDYTSVAFYYGDTPPLHRMEPHATMVPPVVPPVHEYHPRDFSMTFGPGTTTYFKGYGTYMEISGHIPTRGAVEHDADREKEVRGQVRFDLGDLAAGKYRLLLSYDEHPEGGEFSLWRRQQPIGDWVSTYAEGEQEKAMVEMGEIEFTDQIKTLTIRTRGQHGRIFLRLKRIILEAVLENKKIAP